MPALGTVTFTSTHADGNAPVYNGNGVYTLKMPDNAETCNADLATSVDLHQTVSIPVGYCGLIGPEDSSDLVADPDVYVNCQLIRGTGAAIALKVQVVNPTVGNITPTANNDAGLLTIIKTDDYKHDDSPGTWV